MNNQFAITLAHAFSHSANPDADPFGVDLCQSLLRNSLAVILNLRINLARPASNTKYRRLAS